MKHESLVWIKIFFVEKKIYGVGLVKQNLFGYMVTQGAPEGAGCKKQGLQPLTA